MFRNLTDNSSVLITNFNRLVTLTEIISIYFKQLTSLVAWWSELLTTNHEVPDSIPGSTICVFP